jgi:hypothetical protein
MVGAGNSILLLVGAGFAVTVGFYWVLAGAGVVLVLQLQLGAGGCWRVLVGAGFAVCSCVLGVLAVLEGAG